MIECDTYFSIIIPCYNSWRFMKRGLSSLERQIFKDFEVIFVDDCSTDDTYSKLQNYQEQSALNVVLLRNRQNVGPGESRNYAISQAKGKYLLFMDSDDWYEINLLQEVYSEIKEHLADMIFFDFYRAYSENKKKHIHSTRVLEQARSKIDFVALCFDSLWGMCIKREIFQNLKIPHLYNAEDAVTVPLLANRASKIAVLQKPLYNYYYRINSLSSSKNLAIADSILKAFSFLEVQLSDKSEKVALEYRGALMLLYAYVYKSLQARLNVNEIASVVHHFIDKYPDFHNNEYFKKIPLRKRLFILLVKYSQWFLLKVYIKMQDLLISFPANIHNTITHA